MSTTSPHDDARCEICGREFGGEDEAAQHMAQGHGGMSGREPGGTGPEPAGDTEDAGGTVEQTEGGAGRVQTE